MLASQKRRVVIICVAILALVASLVITHITSQQKAQAADIYGNAYDHAIGQICIDSYAYAEENPTQNPSGLTFEEIYVFDHYAGNNIQVYKSWIQWHTIGFPTGWQGPTDGSWPCSQESPTNTAMPAGFPPIPGATPSPTSDPLICSTTINGQQADFYQADVNYLVDEVTAFGFGADLAAAAQDAPCDVAKGLFEGIYLNGNDEAVLGDVATSVTDYTDFSLIASANGGAPDYTGTCHEFTATVNYPAINFSIPWNGRDLAFKGVPATMTISKWFCQNNGQIDPDRMTLQNNAAYGQQFRVVGESHPYIDNAQGFVSVSDKGVWTDGSGGQNEISFASGVSQYTFQHRHSYSIDGKLDVKVLGGGGTLKPLSFPWSPTIKMIVDVKYDSQGYYMCLTTVPAGAGNGCYYGKTPV